MLGYDFGYVTDLVDTKNGKNRFFIVTRFKFEFLHLNFSIWSSVFDAYPDDVGLVLSTSILRQLWCVLGVQETARWQAGSRR